MEDFDSIVAEHRRELLAHCYRMLGSPHDAEDALQDALLGAWKGYAGFEGRSAVRSWLYTIATNACLKQIKGRPRRLLSPDVGPAYTQTADLGDPLPGPWLEPWPGGDDATDPEATYLRRESVELAFVAAVQHLPGTQRAVLMLRDVLRFSAEETAGILGTTVASVTSALQRARRTLAQRRPGRSQQAELGALGDDGVRGLVDRLVVAWEGADVDGLRALLTEDARFTMPPLPAWFAGRSDVLRFFADRVGATPWRLVPISVNAQPGLACYQAEADGEPFRLGAVNVLSLRDGRVCWIAGFVDPGALARFGLPATV